MAAFLRERKIIGPMSETFYGEGSLKKGARVDTEAPALTTSPLGEFKTLLLTIL